MSSNLNICDLSPDLILMVTDFLPYRDKIKLVDLFPCVRNQITVFDMSSMSGYSIDQKMSLFQKLTNVDKVTEYPGFKYYDLPPGFKYCNVLEDFKPLRKLILDGKNKQINHFLFNSSDGYILYGEDVLTYIENVKKWDPSYDASCIKNFFNIKHGHGEELMKEYPDLKLKFILNLQLFCNRQAGSFCRVILKNSSLHDKIVYMKLHGDSIRLIPNEIQRPFESVVELDLKGISILNISNEKFMDILKNILRFTPNLMKLALEVHMSELRSNDGGEIIANEFVSSLFSITKLNQLIVHFTEWNPNWTQQHIDTFQNIVNQLLTSNQKPGLKKLCIKLACKNWDMVQTVSNVDIRNDFKCLELHSIINEQQFEIQNHGIRIYNIQPSIQYLFSRFPKIKWIDIMTDDESYRSRVKQEYQSIKNGLPRNRWLHINFTDGKWHSRVDDFGTSSSDSSDESEEDATGFFTKFLSLFKNWLLTY